MFSLFERKNINIFKQTLETVATQQKLKLYGMAFSISVKTTHVFPSQENFKKLKEQKFKMTLSYKFIIR